MDPASMIASAMPRLQRAAESLMTDTIRITRPGGIQVDPDTGVETTGGILVYEGPGKVQTAGGVAAETNSASGDSSNLGGVVPEWGLYLHLPASVTGTREQDAALVVESADPDLRGRCFRLVNLQSEKTHATARRWNVKEIKEN